MSSVSIADLWPSRFCTTFTGSPPAINIEAQKCRAACQPLVSGIVPLREVDLDLFTVEELEVISGAITFWDRYTASGPAR